MPQSSPGLGEELGFSDVGKTPLLTPAPAGISEGIFDALQFGKHGDEKRQRVLDFLERKNP